MLSEEPHPQDYNPKFLVLSMAKVHPQTPKFLSYMTSRRETFTIWMKSLVFHGSGCTVFDSNGEIVYRIDNYGRKCVNEVCLMDLRGKVLYSIQRKKLQVFGCWDGYKWIGSKANKERPWFQVRRNRRIFRGDTTCCVTLGSTDEAKSSSFTIVALPGRSAFKITDYDGRLVAEVKQKQSSSGVMFGEDVLTLVVEPQIDHSLIMALVTVYGLINHKL
ncbi:protein LURP-one-related 4-like [Cornus florida]|uniref:protein LURP-one-related 4-like n=1 Tax=Cornus florida TaxID=4283 RepID=UPI00289BC377|nr:protein LURP-one-related 4-like [Cornus florida]